MNELQPQEFWIRQGLDPYKSVVFLKKPPKSDNTDYIHVIEYNAFRNLRKELKHCRMKKKLTRKEATERGLKLGMGLYKCKYCNKFHLTSRS